MTQVKVSPKFQVVIPRQLRERLGVKAGQTLMAMEYDGFIQLVPIGTIMEARGALGPSMDSNIKREADRNF